MPETPLANELLIPDPKTEVDHKVNAAHARAVQTEYEAGQ